jgi:RNA recognition motif-containing protein
MGNKLYVGNLPYSVRDGDLEQSFGQFGTVTSAKVMMERDTGRSKGFGFVEMASDAEAQAAISGMNGQPLGGRSLVVNEARPMEPRPPRSGGGGGGYGGGGGGGYGGGGYGGVVAVVVAKAVAVATNTDLPMLDKKALRGLFSWGLGRHQFDFHAAL